MGRFASDYLGVYHDTSSKGRSGKRHDCWRAEITVEGVRYRLGRYQDEEMAARAYMAAALRLRGHTDDPRR